MTTIALFGAAGKMGTRISVALRDDPGYAMLYVEAGEVGQARLRDQGLTPTLQEEAVRRADVAILAVPDIVMGRVAGDVVPVLKKGTMVICLDPAAPYGGELPEREDISYFVTHPCHPPMINDEVDLEARMDFFGGTARQHIVCALMQGPECDYEKGVEIARRMFAPVMKAHRVTVEQMILLEPALSETVALTCMMVVRESLDEIVRRGVPEEVARDFLMGHLRTSIGILFGYIDAEVSDGAKLAAQRAREILLQPDWKAVFDPENVLREVRAITRGIQK